MDISEESRISPLAQDCVKLYQSILIALNNTEDPLLSPLDCLDDLGRFRIWANNIGALLDPDRRASLDSRLQHAPEIRLRIIEVIRKLIGALQDAQDIILGVKENHTWSLEEGGKKEDFNEIHELITEAQDRTTNLMKLSILVREASYRDRYLEAEKNTGQLDDTFDRRHVAEKYPKLTQNPWLLDRLGAAITKRRQFLLYCRDHHDRMHEELPEIFEAKDHSTKASTLKIEKLEILDKDPAIPEGTQATSTTSYTTKSNDNEVSLRVPQLSSVTKSSPFECPLCWKLQDIDMQEAWRTHVFRDLRPYICTFKDCELRLFESRRAWFTHELENHLSNWKCLSCNHGSYSSEDAFLQHTRSHFPSASIKQLQRVADLSRQLPKSLPPACPFCDWTGPTKIGISEVETPKTSSIKNPQKPTISTKEIRSHVGRHMQKLALFAIPQSLLDTNGFESDDTDFDTGIFQPWRPEADWPTDQRTSDCLKAVIQRPLEAANENVRGYIYALRIQGVPDYIKIGHTTRDPSRRRLEWEQNCKQSFETVLGHELPVENVRRVEKIIFTDLRDYRQLMLECPCGMIHKEWWKISEEGVRRCVTRWLEWMATKPYDKLGQLKESHRMHLEELSKPTLN